ncbi:hypothetical protein BJX99DRAFT_232426 [Aspergillus californicus]
MSSYGRHTSVHCCVAPMGCAEQADIFTSRTTPLLQLCFLKGFLITRVTMDNHGIPLGPLPVLMGVAPDATSSDLDTTSSTQTSYPVSTEDTSEQFPQPYAVRPLAFPSHRQLPHQNCYHSVVTRQWRVDQWETCDTCGRKPFMRWFYLCTEDTTSYSDPVDPNGVILSPWIREAILAGEYTDAQRETLIKQKVEVLRMCESERRLARASTQSDSDFGLENLGHPDAELGPYSSRTQTHQVFARCSYRACYQCDRKLQERTWSSLNAVCNDPDIQPPNPWDWYETPVSDARFVSNLGLRIPPPYRPPPPPPPHSPYSYHGSQRRRLQRVVGNYVVGYGSSLDFHAVTNTLSTIEEVSEETEFHQSDTRTEMGDLSYSESLFPSNTSGDEEPEPVDGIREDEVSDESLYS